jgi:hypothetical protein
MGARIELRDLIRKALAWQAKRPSILLFPTTSGLQHFTLISSHSFDSKVSNYSLRLSSLIVLRAQKHKNTQYIQQCVPISLPLCSLQALHMLPLPSHLLPSTRLVNFFEFFLAGREVQSRRKVYTGSASTDPTAWFPQKVSPQPLQSSLLP